MTLPNPISDTLLDEVHELTLACLSGDAGPDAIALLDKLVCENDAALDIYVNAVLDGSTLRRWVATAHEFGTSTNCHEPDVSLPLSATGEADLDSATPLSLFEHECRDRTPTWSSAPNFLPRVLHSTLHDFSEGVLLAYLFATVIFGVGLLIGSRIYVSGPEQIASDLPLRPQMTGARDPQMPFVGRITGMADCKWADDATPARNGAYVPLGRKYAMTSGLMEITYDTGAKVVVQGPVAFEVASKNGGFISVGKLTGKVTAAAARGFTIQTPHAIITDLGTEFGVEVSAEGQTTSHVFRGTIEVRATSPDGNGSPVPLCLHENESARVENRGGHGVIQLGSFVKPADFVRAIRKETTKTLDLVDVVAGGNGFSGQRNRGIDPSSGRVVEQLPEKDEDYFLKGDGRYHRVEGMPFIDGVVIPVGQAGAVQIDSAGHVFSEFGVSENKTCGPIWAGGAGVPSQFDATLGSIDYGSPGHGVLVMHANKAITFDLEAIRHMNQDCRLVRFRAMAGNTEPASARGLSVYADVWVLVDGQVRYRRREINGMTGAFTVAVPLTENDRFLTLAATDSGNNTASDWIIFGDPRLELVSVQSRDESQTGPK